MMFNSENSTGMGFAFFCVVIAGLVFATGFNSMMTGQIDLSFIRLLMNSIGI